MNKKLIGAAILISAILVITGIYINSSFNFSKTPVIVYKSMYCGCCEGYITELKEKDFKVFVKEIEDMGPIKDQYNIPQDMRSCHTVIIGNYFVEGHVPIEAVNKLLEEKPDIDGISLPGMPSGTPGMPGQKTEIWTVYALTDGIASEFMRI